MEAFPQKPENQFYDVVIIGGATSGAAISFFLTKNHDYKGSVLVIDRDPSLKYSATKVSNNCMRQQFATEINVRIAQYGADFVKHFRENLGSPMSSRISPSATSVISTFPARRNSLRL